MVLPEAGIAVVGSAYLTPKPALQGYTFWYGDVPVEIEMLAPVESNAIPEPEASVVAGSAYLLPKPELHAQTMGAYVALLMTAAMAPVAELKLTPFKLVVANVAGLAYFVPKPVV